MGSPAASPITETGIVWNWFPCPERDDESSREWAEGPGSMGQDPFVAPVASPACPAQEGGHADGGGADRPAWCHWSVYAT